MSQQIRALEDNYGVSFFERGNKKFSVTPEGRIFEQAAREILTLLEQIPARLRESSDVVEGAGRRASLSRYEGLKADGLSAEQLQLLQVLVAEYVRNADFDAAEAQLATIGQAGWGELYFSWRGPVDAAGRFYYRVHGPRILIEYNRQDTNHDHTVVRDPRNDYGEDWLGQHLEEHHPSMEEAMENARKRAEELK